MQSNLRKAFEKYLVVMPQGLGLSKTAFFAYYYSEGEGGAWFGIAAFITLSLTAVFEAHDRS